MPEETDKATAKELQRIRRLPENRVCPNCLKEESVGFGAVCTTFKTFICHDCKSAHQSFSHRCKSVQMSIWTMEEVKALDECNGGGNAAVARYYLSRLPEKERIKQGSSPDAYKRFIERAYIKLRWAAEQKAPATEKVKEEKVEHQVLPKPENPVDDSPSLQMSKEHKTKRKSRKSRCEGGKLELPDAKPPISQEVSWHPEVEVFQNQADGAYGWMSHDAYTYSYPEQENYWAPQQAGPYPAYDHSYPGSLHEEIGHATVNYSQNVPGSPLASHNEKWQTGAASSTASPPFSAAASWSTWSSPTVKAASLPLDPTNPWAEDVLQLCEKHGQNVAGRFDLSPAMAGRSTHVPSWGETAM